MSSEETAMKAKHLVTLCLLAVCTAFLVSGSANPFLYFRF